MVDIEKIAEAIRTAYLKNVGEEYRQTWEEMPDHRKEKWREMAMAAVDAMDRQMP